MAKKKVSSVEKLDPKQITMLVGYIDPKSPTFSNALQSALAAGFSRQYSENITHLMPNWLSDSLSETMGNKKKVSLSEKHLEEVLEMPIIDQAMGAFGPLYEKKVSYEPVVLKNGKKKLRKLVEKVPVMTYLTSRIKEKTNVAQFTLESLDRKRYGKEKEGKVAFNFNFNAAKEKYKA